MSRNEVRSSLSPGCRGAGSIGITARRGAAASRGDLSGRSLEAVTSVDAAVRGHRLFALDELEGVVLHPPIQRFLTRWQPGDPAVYLGSMWVP